MDLLDQVMVLWRLEDYCLLYLNVLMHLLNVGLMVYQIQLVLRGLHRLWLFYETELKSALLD